MNTRPACYDIRGINRAADIVASVKDVQAGRSILVLVPPSCTIARRDAW